MKQNELKNLLVQMRLLTEGQFEECLRDSSRKGQPSPWGIIRQRGFINMDLENALEMAMDDEMSLGDVRASLEAYRQEASRPIREDTSSADPAVLETIQSNRDESDTEDSFDVETTGTSLPKSNPLDTVDIIEQISEDSDTGQLALEALVGERLGDYEIRSQLSSSPTGVIYLGVQARLRAPVAVKVLSPSLSRLDPEFADQLLEEASRARAVEHPNIVQVLDCGKEAGFHFIVMEHADGMSLRELLDLNRRLDPPQALIAIQLVCEALAVAHEKGVIHRGIQPRNILITRSKQVKLADLGLGKNLTGKQADIDTYEMLFRGLPFYRAPEMAENGSNAGARTDIYSIGATLYHLVTGVEPFRGATRAEILRKHREQPLVPAEEVARGVPPVLSEMISMMLSKDPSQRPGHCRQLAQQIERCLTTILASDTRPGRDARSVRKIRDLLSGAALEASI